ncbi:MAG: sensor histidine kinase [Saprospiraceae bacterium]|nr:sensor histidine kinase [Saprospiraceae bacterium]
MASLIYEAAENGKDTTLLVQNLEKIGVSSSQGLLDRALAIPGVTDSDGFMYTIMDAQRRKHLLLDEFRQAYQILWDQKTIYEEYKLSESSLEALADMKIQYEIERLRNRLLEEEIINSKKERQVNLLVFSIGVLLSALIIGVLFYQNRIKANQLLLTEAKQEQQIISMRSMLDGQEKERSRIARDLHDGLGNLLSTLKAKISTLKIDFDNKGTTRIYNTASDMIDEACSEVRKIAHKMMPQALKKLGLRKALEDLITKMDMTHPFDAQFLVYGSEKLLNDNTNVMLFRIVQELLNNIVKYAQADEVLLQLTYSDEWLNLTIEDDGKGFDIEQIDSEKGMGLKSIEFRTGYVGGNYEIDSRPGAGTLVTINVPLQRIESDSNTENEIS